MTKFFNKFKKSYFGPVLFKLWGKTFYRKSGSVFCNFIWVSSTMPKFRKNSILRKHADRGIDGRTEGWTDHIF